MFKKGERVVYIPENKVYDFGYLGRTGKAIIYEEGKHNMQDSYAVDIKKLNKESKIKSSIKDTFKKIFEASIFDKKSLEQKALKLAEETGEVAQAILSYCDAPACGYKNKTKENVIEELIDCIITASSILYQIEEGIVNEAQFCKVLDTKLEKWINKSTQNKRKKSHVRINTPRTTD
jgi:NTP pyrophosphatase (non-canonical NTP hydrolase)